MLFYLCFVLVTLFSQGKAVFNPIAFTLGQNAHVDHVAAASNTDVPFNVVITSHGNPTLTNGRFVCNADGLYKFQVYALTKSGTNIFLEIYHNTQLVATLWGHTNSDYAAAGNAVVLPLMTGDTVEVKVRGDYEVHIYGTDSEIYTTFTGVQLGSSESLIEGASLSAFSATLSQHQVVSSGSPVLYNNILTDVNQGYNQTTGIYTAPSGGLYLFHFFSLARQDQEEWQELFRNDQYVCSIYGKDSQEWADAGNSVLLHLNAGDQITIKSHNGRTSTLYGSPDEIYSTFSGVQIATDYDLATDGGSFGFSAGLTNHQLVHMDTNVVYDHVFYDDQGAYDLNTGTFTAPTSGLYEFNYHALGKQGVAIWLELFQNDKYVNSLYSHVVNSWAGAGNSAVLNLMAGDRVSVRAHNNQALYGGTDEIYCTFTGYLLSSGPSNVAIG